MGLWGMFVATSRGADLEPREGGRSVLARSGAAINAVIVRAVAPVLGDEGVPTLGSTAIMRWETTTPWQSCGPCGVLGPRACGQTLVGAPWAAPSGAGAASAISNKSSNRKVTVPSLDCYLPVCVATRYPGYHSLAAAPTDDVGRGFPVFGARRTAEAALKAACTLSTHGHRHRMRVHARAMARPHCVGRGAWSPVGHPGMFDHMDRTKSDYSTAEQAEEALVSRADLVVAPPHEQDKNAREDVFEVDEQVHRVLEVVVFTHLVLVDHLLRIVSDVQSEER